MNGHLTPPIADLTADAAREDGASARTDGDAAPTVERCLNCATELTGRYCARCGQDSHHPVQSLRAVAGELIEDLAAADARVWRTLRMLALRPGQLTCEYLRGKRASYTPPLRLYVALSLLLFVVTMLPDDSTVNVKINATGSEPVSLSPEATAALDAALQGVEEQYRQALGTQVSAAVVNVPARRQVSAINDLVGACGEGPLGLAVLNTGIAQALPYEQVVANCKKVAAPSQKLLSDGAEYAPKMMVFFLPLIALFGKLLYLGSRRPYIGHLIFFVHFHAFVFLAMAAGNLAGSLATLSGIKWLEGASGLIVLALTLWVPIYLYKAMRRVYAQGRWVTRMKFAFLGVGYLINFLISLVLLGLFVALQNDVNWKDGLEAIELSFKGAP